ncbi:MAG: hypothetical protein ACRDXX_08725 [Stackebrandtia sp.]
MTTSDADITSTGEAVRDKAVEKWMELEGGGPAAFHPDFEGAVRDAFGYIVPMFEMYAQRDPDRIESMQGQLTNVRATLKHSAPEAVDTVKGYVQDWEGRAAESFTTEFLQPLPQIKTNQLQLVEELSKSLDVVREMLTSSRRDIVGIGRETEAALDGLENSGETALALSVVSNVVSMIGSGAGGNPAGVAASVVSGGVDIANSIMAYEQQKLGGGDVMEVVDSMIKAHEDLWTVRETVEERLAELLGEDLGLVREMPDEHRPKMPDLAHLDREDFEPPL